MTSSNNNKLVTNTSEVLHRMLEYNCITWHPHFQEQHLDLINLTINNALKSRIFNKDNKWGFQYNIKEELKNIPIDNKNINDIKNMIVLDHYIVTFKNSEYFYKTKNPISIYEIFISYCNKYNSKKDIWYYKEINNLKVIHQEKQNNYTFHSIDENDLETLAKAVIYLIRNTC